MTRSLRQKNGLLKDPYDIIGKRSGMIVVEEYIGKIRNIKYKRFDYFYLVRCDCGNTAKIVRPNILTGHSKTCGCSYNRTGINNPAFSGAGLLSGSIWSGILIHARKRNHDVKITVRDAWNLYLSQDRKCALTGVDIHFRPSKSNRSQTASLDRIDNCLGYTIENVQWLHKDVNWMKGKYSTERFLEICGQIAIKTLGFSPPKKGDERDK